MAWRPTEYLLEGELDNTTPGKVTGWVTFAGLNRKVTFDLKGDFHRDIRGARIRFSGNGNGANPDEAGKYMEGFSGNQTGKVGDMTAGLPPQDYTTYPYLEWYGDDNGRVVIELEPEQLTVTSPPIPWCESDPISRSEQQLNMAKFLAGICQAVQVPAMAVGGAGTLVSDPKFSHWVIVDGRIIGEAHSVEKVSEDRSFAFVRMYDRPEDAEYSHIPNNQLLAKSL